MHTLLDIAFLDTQLFQGFLFQGIGNLADGFPGNRIIFLLVKDLYIIRKISGFQIPGRQAV